MPSPSHARVAELDLGAVAQHIVHELDLRSGRKVTGGPGGFDERGQTGDVISLNMRLEHGDDRRADALGLGEVALDERLVRVDYRELLVCQTAEEVRGAGRLVVEEGTQDHVPRLRRCPKSG